MKHFLHPLDVYELSSGSTSSPIAITEGKTGYIVCGNQCKIKTWNPLFKIIRNFKTVTAKCRVLLRASLLGLHELLAAQKAISGGGYVGESHGYVNYISLMMNGIEHIFMYLLTTLISSFKNSLFNSFAYLIF